MKLNFFGRIIQNGLQVEEEETTQDPGGLQRRGPNVSVQQHLSRPSAFRLLIDSISSTTLIMFSNEKKIFARLPQTKAGEEEEGHRGARGED